MAKVRKITLGSFALDVRRREESARRQVASLSALAAAGAGFTADSSAAALLKSIARGLSKLDEEMRGWSDAGRP